MHTSLEFDTAIVRHPFKRLIRVIDKVAGERRVAMSFGHLDHVVIELIGRIAGDPCSALHLRIRAEHKSGSVNRIARGIHHLF